MNDAGIGELIRRLTRDGSAAKAATLASARTSSDPMVLIVAALFDAATGDLVDRANRGATSTRDRQIVAIAAAHLDGDRDRVGALVRDHLVSHPHHPVVSWIIANDNRQTGANS